MLDGKRELALGLADAGEHDLFRRNAGGARAQQLAFGDHVGAGAEPRQRRDHGLIGIGLHRVTDERVDVGEGFARRRDNAAPASRSHSNRTACRRRRRASPDRQLRRAARRRDKRSDAWRVFKASTGCQCETSAKRPAGLPIDDCVLAERPPQWRGMRPLLQQGSRKKRLSSRSAWRGVAVGSKPVFCAWSPRRCRRCGAGRRRRRPARGRMDAECRPAGAGWSGTPTRPPDLRQPRPHRRTDSAPRQRLPQTRSGDKSQPPNDPLYRPTIADHSAAARFWRNSLPWTYRAQDAHFFGIGSPDERYPGWAIKPHRPSRISLGSSGLRGFTFSGV